MSRLVGILRFTPDAGVSADDAAKIAERLGFAIEQETEKIVKHAVVAVIVTAIEAEAKAAEAALAHPETSATKTGRTSGKVENESNSPRRKRR